MFRSAPPVTASQFNTLQPITAQAMQVVQQHLAAQQRAAENLAKQEYQQDVLQADALRAQQADARAARAQQSRERLELMRFQADRQDTADRMELSRAKFAQSSALESLRQNAPIPNNDLEREYLKARIGASNRSNLPSGDGTVDGSLFQQIASASTDPNISQDDFDILSARGFAAGDNAPIEVFRGVRARNFPDQSTQLLTPSEQRLRDKEKRNRLAEVADDEAQRRREIAEAEALQRAAAQTSEPLSLTERARLERAKQIAPLPPEELAPPSPEESAEVDSIFTRARR